MKTTTCFNIKIIENAMAKGYTKPLALYYLIKAKFWKSVIYDYTPYKLSQLSGLHHKTVKRYVARLEKEGLVQFNHGHLFFISGKKIAKGTLKKLPTRPYTSFDGILKRIYTAAALNNREQQNFNIAVKCGTNIGQLSERTRRKALRRARLEPITLESITVPIISVHSASKLFNVSKNTSAKILRELKNYNYLKLNPYVKRIGRFPKHPSFLNGSYFNSNGWLFRYFGRTLEAGKILNLYSI
jgi:Mn-dependent DtxR family transcriptional regulator